MGILDFFRGELSRLSSGTTIRATRSYRLPDEDKAIKTARSWWCGSRSRRNSCTSAIRRYLRPGTHTLMTANIPVLTRLKAWKYGFSPLQGRRLLPEYPPFTGNKWGTANPVMMRDNDFGIVRVRAFGTYDFRIIDPKRFLKEVAGSDHHFRLDDSPRRCGRGSSAFSPRRCHGEGASLGRGDPLFEARRGAAPVDQPCHHYQVRHRVHRLCGRERFVPPEVEQAIDKRSSMAAVGNLNDYVKFQMAEGMERAAAAGGFATEMAVGMAMAQQMMQQQGLGAKGPGCAAGACGFVDSGTARASGGRADSRRDRTGRHSGTRGG